VYGYQLKKVTAKEQELLVDPKEIEVRYAYAVQAELLRKKLENPAQALKDDRRSAESRIATLKASGAPVAEVLAAERALSGLPRDAKAAQRQWTAALAQAETKSLPLNGMPPHGQQFAGNPDGTLAEQAEFDLSRRNFLALVFCLMVGTAALPHILIRYYTVPTVREARRSVAWSMLFILLLYLTAPALAVLVKYEVLTQVVGTSFSQLPEWLAAWSAQGVIDVLNALDDQYGGERYRVSPWLRQQAWAALGDAAGA
jgi:cation/acetate symporter